MNTKGKTHKNRHATNARSNKTNSMLINVMSQPPLSAMFMESTPGAPYLLGAPHAYSRIMSIAGSFVRDAGAIKVVN